MKQQYVFCKYTDNSISKRGEVICYGGCFLDEKWKGFEFFKENLAIVPRGCSIDIYYFYCEYEHIQVYKQSHFLY